MRAFFPFIAGGLLITAPPPAAGSPLQEEANAAITSAHWHERAVADGVLIRTHRFDALFGSPQIIHVVESDMNNPAVGFALCVRPGEERATVSAFASGLSHPAAVVNGNFFNHRGSVQYLRIDGSLIAPTLNDRIDDRGGLSIDAAGVLHARSRDAIGGWEGLGDPDIMATNIPLVIDGEPFPFGAGPFYERDRHPRTLAGTTSGGKALFVVVDGRSAIAAGMTYVESAAAMIALGAENAVNLDGGGSSTLWDAGLPGNGVGNIPSDGSQRAVSNAVAVLSTAPPPAKPRLDALRAPGRANASPHALIPVTAVSGTKAEVSIRFINAGTEAWKPGEVFLVTSEPFGRESDFSHEEWISPSRPAVLRGNAVPPGSEGTFTFTLRAPSVEEAVALEESVALAGADGVPFGPHQNRVSLTVLPPPNPRDFVVESRAAASQGGGVTARPAYEESGAFADTVSKSRADSPALMGAGARFSTSIGSTATFRPEFEEAGQYNVYLTMGAGSNNNARAGFTIAGTGGEVTGTISLSHSGSEALVDGWKLIASGVRFDAGGGHSVMFTNIDGDNGRGRRFVMDAVRFQWTGEGNSGAE